MKRLLGVLLAGLWAFTGTAEDSLGYLYWEVGSANTIGFAYARCVKVSDGTETTLGLVDADGNVADYAFAAGYVPSSSDAAATLGTTTGGGVWSQGTFGSNTDLFFLELYGESGLVACSAQVGYSDIAQYVHSDITSQLSTAWTPVLTATTLAPEPTSGLLFLVGGALLGLRRKRRAALEKWDVCDWDECDEGAKVNGL